MDDLQLPVVHTSSALFYKNNASSRWVLACVLCANILLASVYVLEMDPSCDLCMAFFSPTFCLLSIQYRDRLFVV
jgi:hypothetical protein